MVSSNLDSVRHCPSVHCTRSTLCCWLEIHSLNSRPCPVHDRECSGDRINRVQSLQGVPWSQDCYCGWPSFRGHWRKHTSACHIHNNWICYGFVFNPIGSACGYHCNHACFQGCLFLHHWYPWNAQCDYIIIHCYIILLITLTFLGYNAHHYIGASVNGVVFPRWEFDGGS